MQTDYKAIVPKTVYILESWGLTSRWPRWFRISNKEQFLFFSICDHAYRCHPHELRVINSISHVRRRIYLWQQKGYKQNGQTSAAGKFSQAQRHQQQPAADAKTKGSFSGSGIPPPPPIALIVLFRAVLIMAVDWIPCQGFATWGWPPPFPAFHSTYTKPVLPTQFQDVDSIVNHSRWLHIYKHFVCVEAF